MNEVTASMTAVIEKTNDKPELYKILRGQIKSPLKVFVKEDNDPIYPSVTIHIYGDKDFSDINFHFRLNNDEVKFCLSDNSWTVVAAEVLDKFENYILEKYLWRS